jgi:hypothetical protein
VEHYERLEGYFLRNEVEKGEGMGMQETQFVAEQGQDHTPGMNMTRIHESGQATELERSIQPAEKEIDLVSQPALQQEMAPTTPRDDLAFAEFEPLLKVLPNGEVEFSLSIEEIAPSQHQKPQCTRLEETSQSSMRAASYLGPETRKVLQQLLFTE